MKRSRATLFMSTAYDSLAGGSILMWEKLIRNQFGENRFTEAEKFFYTTKCKNFMYWRISLFFVFYLFNWFVVFSFVVIIRKVPGMQLPDLASTSLFTAVGLNHKKLARPSESPTNSSRSWLHRFRFSQSMFASLKVWNVVHWTYLSSVA